MNHAGSTLAHVLQRRAAEDGDRQAYVFLADGATDARSMTWSQLHRRASGRAGTLCAQGAGGQPVLLMLPSGLPFVEWLLACWYAGAIAVPISLPRHHRAAARLGAIIANAGARFVIGAQNVRERLNLGADLVWINTDESDAAVAPNFALRAEARQPAVLQYTSGSTGSPRGVVVTHANLMQNSALIAEACGHGPADTIGGWLPLFHDMGLIGLVIQAAFSGARCIFMPPERFLMRPWQWLQMISDYRICSSPAPNFAYDLCVDKVSEQQKRSLNLSAWRNALNGSEPVRAGTLDRFAAAFASCSFRKDAFFPCYGLAEATLFVTGRSSSRSPARRTSHGAKLSDEAADGHVGCGRAFGDTQIAIVDPSTRWRLPDGEIGEIWVSGESCAKGYWRDPEASAATFNARLDSTSPQAAARSWLRTGDLGMLINGELFITGRLRELIIIAGRNLFPVDLERTVESAHPAIAPSGAAAFSVDIDGVERLIVAAEVRRQYGRRGAADGPALSLPNGPDYLDSAQIVRQVRAAIATEHEVAPHDVLLLRPGALPRTTSGKLNRGATRHAFLTGALDLLEGSHVCAR